MEYQQQQFTPYDPYASYGAQSASASTSSVRQSQSPTMSNAYPAYSTSGAHGNGANAYPSVPQPRQQQQQQQLQQHEHRGFNLQAIAPMVGSRDSSSGPARQGATHRREYSTGAGNGVPHAAGGGGRGPYARPSEPAPLSAREGAGPGTVKASSTTSEFTKRKNWSQHIIDEIQDFMHVLAPDGTVMFAAPSIQDLTGWSPDEVTGHPISDFIHADDVESFLRDFDASLRDGSELNVYYRFRMKDDRYTIFEIAGHAYYAVDEVTGERKCKCFFGMGRPYPSKNTAMLDSFLELKMENERLRQELQVMYRDIEGGSSYSPYPGQGRNAFPSPFSNHDVALGHSPPQFEPRSGAGVIDPATGLVQTSGLIPSSSNTYGALGIGISQTGAKGEGVPGDKKKKKPRVEEGDFVCRDCGTVDSPEWRKGPEGPKSLCNACGLRYAKLRSKDKLKGEVK